LIQGVQLGSPTDEMILRRDAQPARTRLLDLRRRQRAEIHGWLLDSATSGHPPTVCTVGAEHPARGVVGGHTPTFAHPAAEAEAFPGKD
jgi:hypothetical protein